MATEVSEQVAWVADQWENHCGYRSAVLSGIRPDSRHVAGYHPSINDLKAFGVAATDYSNRRSDDKGFNPAYGAAIDMSMAPADMRLCYSRVRKVYDDKADPRRQYLNAINVWDGSGDAARLDFYADVAGWASPDHTWHNHQEFRRRFVRDWKAARAIVSILSGEAKAVWVAREEQPPIEEDDVSQQDVIAALSAPAAQPALTAAVLRGVHAALTGAVNRDTPTGRQIGDALRVILADASEFDAGELEQIRAALQVPSAADNAQAVLTALNGLGLADLRAVLVRGLGEQRARELGLSLTTSAPA